MTRTLPAALALTAGVFLALFILGGGPVWLLTAGLTIGLAVNSRPRPPVVPTPGRVINR